jgi:DNA-binding beta-propeller fold protein YncE
MRNKTIKNSLLGIIVLLVSLVPSNGYTQNLLNGPQKIVIDTKRNRLLVSNANSGDLIQIDSIGTQTYFIQGANFIDGMEIVGDTVYGVGNNRKIKAYNLVTKQLVLDFTLQGSPTDYLSSIAFDSKGHLFISCPLLNEIYRMRINDLSYWVFAKDSGLNKPNGILLEKEKNRIVIIDDSPDSKIHAVNLADSSVSTLYSTSFDSPDGIVRDKLGNYYIGGYYLKGIFKIDLESGEAFELFFKGSSMVYPTYDERNHSILVTHYDSNTWERIPLKNFHQ